MRRRDPLEPRREDEAAGERRTPEPAAEASILELQRTAGNRAVSALLARQPAPADSPEMLPTTERGATMTLGLGDDIGVIPLDSAAWGEFSRGGLHELHVTFVDNPATPKIQQAVINATPIKSAFYSTTRTMSTMTDVVLMNISMTESHGEVGMYINLTLNFQSIDHKLVR